MMNFLMPTSPKEIILIGKDDMLLGILVSNINAPKI